MKNVASFIKLRVVSMAFALLLLCTSAGFAQTTAAFQFDTTLVRGLQWRNIGPFRGGRVDAVPGVTSQPLVYYFGATGGVWKTESAGKT